MSAGEITFDDAELALIAAEFDRERGDFGGEHDRGTPPVRHARCRWCHRAIPVERREDEARHAPHCQGVARRRVAAKARRMQQGVTSGGGQ